MYLLQVDVRDVVDRIYLVIIYQLVMKVQIFFMLMYVQMQLELEWFILDENFV